MHTPFFEYIFQTEHLGITQDGTVYLKPGPVGDGEDPEPEVLTSVYGTNWARIPELYAEEFEFLLGEWLQMEEDARENRAELTRNYYNNLT